MSDKEIRHTNSDDELTNPSDGSYRAKRPSLQEDADSYVRAQRPRPGRSGRPSARNRAVLPIAAGLIGLFLGIWLSLFVLPGTSFFQGSKMGEYINGQIRSATGSSGVTPVPVQQTSGVENQKDIIDKTSNTPNMSVSEIVAQYESSVVTIVAEVEDTEFEEEIRNFIGTGFILNGDGMIATNQHVISGADKLTVILSDGRELSAHEVNSDPDTDLAIIRLDDEIKLPGIVTVGNSDDIIVGEQVVAIGSPVSRNFAGTVTSGIISGKDRAVYIGGTRINYLQTDAAINEGNSGGPLFNAKGEVIGINTAKMSEDIQSIGFAIPINTLKEKLVYLSRVPLYTGFTAKDLNEDAKEALGLDNGVVVMEVEEGSPAERAGLESNDIILTFDGRAIENTSQMNEIRERREAGDIIEMLVKRGEENLKMQLKLSSRP